jgi:nitrate reductase NapD
LHRDDDAASPPVILQVDSHAMNLSGILVRALPPHVDDVVARLRALPGVDVHEVDVPTGRVVVVQEAPTVDDEVAGLARIKSVPGVIAADMVYHYFAEDPALSARSAAIDTGNASPD